MPVKGQQETDPVLAMGVSREAERGRRTIPFRSAVNVIMHHHDVRFRVVVYFGCLVRCNSTLPLLPFKLTILTTCYSASALVMQVPLSEFVRTLVVCIAVTIFNANKMFAQSQTQCRVITCLTFFCQLHCIIHSLLRLRQSFPRSFLNS
jgi:hypothetical protein